jgi:hypothetical protein
MVSIYRAAASGEYVVAGLALIILWIICLVSVRRRKDHLRKPFLWLKLAIPFFFLYGSEIPGRPIEFKLTVSTSVLCYSRLLAS